MSRFTESCRSETLVNETMCDHAEVTVKRAPRLDVSLPDGFELVQMQQPLEHCSTFDRSGPAQSPSRLPGANIWHSRQPSDTGSFKTVITQDSDGKFTKVQRPVRLTNIPSESSCYDTTMDSAPASTAQSSPKSDRETNQNPTISATSQDIQIGLNTRSSTPSASGSDQGGDSLWDETVSTTFLTHTLDRPAYPKRNFSNEKSVSAQHVEEPDPWGFLSPLPQAHLSRGSGFDMDHHRGGPSAQAVRLISVADTGSLWTRRFLRHHAYVLAVLSILLPAAFLAFGIAVTFADGKPVPSQWHLVWKLADVLSTAWPIILAAVAVQCLVSWMTLRAKRCQAEHIESGNVPEQAFNRSQIEAICLFLFFGLTIAPVGSLALRNVFGTGFATHHSPVDVWYIDRTGQNALWSESPTSTLSTTSRQELIQTVGEKYARDLLLDINSQNPGESFSYATTIAPMNSRIFLRSSILQTERQNNETPSSALASDQNATVPSTITLTHQIMLDLTTSYLDFVCGAWNLKIRDFEDFTTPGEMSYSSSQTLGMSMAASSGNAEFPTGNVTIASLNKITENGLLALDESWEYSTIQCTWTQLFYNAPVQCDWDDNVGLSNCVQYAESQLLLNPGGVSGTPLQDFANDFVLSGNIPTAERIATATERYIQNGGPASTVDRLNLDTDSTGLLNLSAAVTPNQFAQRFGHLFNTWVALGYCPQCSPEIAVGNGTIPAGLQAQYRRTTSTLAGPGIPFLIVNWRWEAVILALSLILFVMSLIAIFGEYGQSIVPSCGRRRKEKKLGNDQDLMRVLLSEVHAAVPPSDRFPMPRRPVSNRPAPVGAVTSGTLPETQNMRQRISARLSKMSAASFTLPIQGTRIQQVAEEPDCEAGSSAQYFARRYSNIPEERYPQPRRRSASEGPPPERRSAVCEMSKHVPSVRYSFLPNTSRFSRHSGGGGFGKLSDDEEEDFNKAVADRMISVRYSNIPSFRYRTPERQSQQSAAAVSPAPAPTESVASPKASQRAPGERGSEGSWAYGEYMSSPRSS